MHFVPLPPFYDKFLEKLPLFYDKNGKKLPLFYAEVLKINIFEYDFTLQAKY